MSQPPTDNSASLPGAPVAPVAPAPAITQSNPAPGAAGSAQNVPPPARRDRKPRRDGLAPSSATISGIPAIYSLVATAPFHTVQEKSNSLFIPSFIAAAVIIDSMNSQMAYTHRFLQSAPAWIPPVSFVYFGVLFVIQTLRASREISANDDSERWFLEGFTSNYDLRSLLIPGPLVPVFQALAACSGPIERLGDVSPQMPKHWTCQRVHSYMLSNDLSTILPDVPFYMDILNRISTHGADYTDQEMRTFHRSVMNQNAAVNAGSSLHFYSPGAWSHVSWSLAQLNAARSALSNFNFPPALDVTDTLAPDITDWTKFLRFYHVDGTFYPWFGNVAATMQRYCQFFSESVPLSAISPAGAAISIPVWNFAPHNRTFTHPFTFVPAIANGAPAHYTTTGLTSLACQGTHCDETLEEVAEQCSAIALVNVDLYTSSRHPHAPTNQMLRSGPVWQLPIARRSPRIDYALGVSQSVTSHYRRDTRTT
nr:MAG: coat protein [Grapevine alphapartitivirus]